MYDVRLGRVTLAIKRLCLVVKIKDKSVQPVLLGEALCVVILSWQMMLRSRVWPTFP
jgi:hypothetical protein